MSKLLDGKIAIVTGGADGIGHAIVDHFCAEGARVVVADIDLADKADWPASVLSMRCDVSKKQDVDALVARTVEEIGDIDILVNNAGKTGNIGAFLDVTDEDWRAFIDTNLTGAFLVGQAVARAMTQKRTGGRIINIGSINAFGAEPEASPYVASKAGLLGLTRAMAVDLARYDIVVNLLAPGPITVDRNAELFANKPLQQGLAQSVPLGGPGKPGNVAEAAVFLASDRCQYMTGASLLIDGGVTSLLRLS